MTDEGAQVPEPLSIPPGIDVDTPNVTRIYDFLLGGTLNFAADRAAATKLLALVPEAASAAKASRAFLSRVVRYLLAEGIRQFIDLGTGLPTQGHVHHVLTLAADDDIRVVYVDNDPLVLAHIRALLVHDHNATAILADLRDPADVLSEPELTGLIDLDAPVAVLLFGILDRLPDEARPTEIVGHLRDAVAPGSYFAFTHALDNGAAPEEHEAARSLLARSKHPCIERSPAQVLGLADGLDLVEPGLVWISQWRPDDDAQLAAPHESFRVGMVGRTPAAGAAAVRLPDTAVMVAVVSPHRTW